MLAIPRVEPAAAAPAARAPARPIQDPAQLQAMLERLLDALIHEAGERDPSGTSLSLPAAVGLCGTPAFVRALQSRLVNEGLATEAWLQSTGPRQAMQAFADFLLEPRPDPQQALTLLAASFGDRWTAWVLTEAVLREGERPGLRQRIDAFAKALPAFCLEARLERDTRWAQALLTLVQSPSLSAAQRLRLLMPPPELVSSWLHYALRDETQAAAMSALGRILAVLELSDAQKREVLHLRTESGVPSLLRLLRETYTELAPQRAHDPADLAADEPGTLRHAPKAHGIRAFDRMLSESGLPLAAQASLLDAILAGAELRPLPERHPDHAAVQDALGALRAMQARVAMP